MVSDSSPWARRSSMALAAARAGSGFSATTAFSLAELYESLVAVERGEALADAGDLGCWLSGGQP